MGRLSNEPIIQHFSHTHPLQLLSLDQLQQQSLAPILCANCRLPARGGYGYACSPCSYVLHVQCSQMPPLIHHASHQAHPLSLLPVPAYPEGSFDCDACAKPGTGFSYHCHTCGVDLHTLCASLPLSLPNAALHAHPLALTFAPPYENKAFSCDACGGMGSSQWLYRCTPCEFDAHLECGGRQQQQQQQQPSPVGRSGSVVVQGSPRAVAMSRSGSGGMQGLVGGVGGVGGMVQGLVSTTTQQVGSRFVPGYVGDGGAGANGGGRGGGPGGAWNGSNQGGRGRGRGGGGIGYNGWNGNGGGRGGGGPPGAWNGYGGGRGQGGGPPGAWNGYGGGRGQGGGGGPTGAWNGYGGGRGQGGGPPGAWNGYGGGRGQGGGGPGAGSDPNGAQASYNGNGGGNGDGSGAQASYDNGGNGDGSGDWNGYVDSSAGDVSGVWNGYDDGDGGGGNGGDGVDYGSVVEAAAGVDYGSVVDAVSGVGSAVLNAFGGGSDDN